MLGGGVQGQFLTAPPRARGGARVTVWPTPTPSGASGRCASARAPYPTRPATRATWRALRTAMTGGRGADVVFEAVGRPETWELAVALARPGGEVLLHGGCAAGTEVTLPTGPLHYGELRVQGSYHHTPPALRRALALLAAGAAPYGELLGAPDRPGGGPGRARRRQRREAPGHPPRSELL